jgi:hypothetical protein
MSHCQQLFFLKRAMLFVAELQRPGQELGGGVETDPPDPAGPAAHLQEDPQQPDPDASVNFSTDISSTSFT